MFLNAVSHYLPEQVIGNDYFTKINGLSDEWLLSRTGIRERRKALPSENSHSMAIESVKAGINNVPYPVKDVDLVIGATYTPFDTIGTLAHYVQQSFEIRNAQAVTITSACASFINALEIAQGYFSLNKAKTALIVASEHNSAYNDETDIRSGHLWGDGAAAVFVSKERKSDQDYEILDIVTKGLANEGKSTDGIWLRPQHGGLQMPHGRDVYIQANKYMINILQEILERNNLSVEDVDFLIPHQANLKIIKHIQHDLGLTDEKILINIDKLGNTGCASAVIAFSQNLEKFQTGNLIALTVFGGGYSSGAALFKKL
jgi:3-oxoacyl-[acyl-carrier-protein] synthase III